MLPPKKIVSLKPFKFAIVSLSALLLIGSLWLIFMGLSYAGFPMPAIPIEKFFDLGFFSISIFGLFVFLTLIPFQTAESKLSPGFYSRIFNTPLAHFGIHVLISCSVICFLVVALHERLVGKEYLSPLFMAIVTTIIFAILLHRFWVLRCIYQPYIVYNHLQNLREDESEEGIWLDLFECTHKAIKGGRVSDAKHFIDLMSYFYNKCSIQKRISLLNEDILNLHAIAQDVRPSARFIEEKWPFVLKANTAEAFECRGISLTETLKAVEEV